MLDVALAYINNHLEETISLDELAKVTGYSPFHLHRMLKEELQEPVGSFIIKQRIQAASYLLCMTELPVMDICLLVGYDNDSAFSRVFKKSTGHTPREYRKNRILKAGSTDNHKYISLKCEVVRLPEQQAILFPSVGNYFSAKIFNVWHKAAELIKDLKLNEEDFTYYSVFHDCQNLNPEGTGRYDAALVCKRTMNLPINKNFITQLPGGKYAKYKFCCPVAEYEQVTKLINEHLYVEMKLKHREGVSYFQYTALPDLATLDNMFIEWYLPVY